MGSKTYNRCLKCKVDGCPDRKTKIDIPFTYCEFFSKERKEYPKRRIPDNDWEAKIKERNEMNKQYE